MVILRVLLGILLGAALAGGGFYLFLWSMDVDPDVALIGALITGCVGLVYSAIAFAFNIYKFSFLSILGYVLDMTWSILNTLGGLLVWIPACKIVGGTLQTGDPNTKRSGTFAYDINPRDRSGTRYQAMTIGTVIGGGWSSHEELHVWQARIFGPFYFLLYVLSLGLNALFRLLTIRTSNLGDEAYHRVCLEEWAYWGGSVTGSEISWGGWFGGFFLTLAYVTPFALIVIGIVDDNPALWVIGLAGVALYNLIRALLPRGH